ncbi:MAG: hypothetical protein NT154_36920 [Verrucomicrobia bacterium]|nr:hypothetical protein [Verrucomicrobiota bacterium]
MKRLSVFLCSIVLVGSVARSARSEDLKGSQGWRLGNPATNASSLTLDEPKPNENAEVAATAERLRAEDPLISPFSDRLAKASLLSLRESKPNEIVRGNLTYGGIAVAVLKSDNPLQLLNPFASDKYGSGEDNVLRDLKTGGISGWKLFSIRF